MLREQFRGMGSRVTVEVHGGSRGHLSLARDRVAFLEARWSRFRPSSDISALNRANGEPVVVDPSTIELLEVMMRAHLLTDGSYDPTLLAPIVQLGYAASVHDPANVTELPPGAQPRGHIRGLSVDVGEQWARLPSGTMVDAGGIGKGLAADIVAALLMANDATGVMVDIGGDARVMGDGPHDGRWRVPVDAAFEPEVTRLGVMVKAGGVGTSGTLRRSWLSPDGEPAHHVLDPRTGRPTPGGFDAPVHATVLAPTAVDAEMHATMALVRGAQHALPALQSEGHPARIVYGSGASFNNLAWESVPTVDPTDPT